MGSSLRTIEMSLDSGRVSPKTLFSDLYHHSMLVASYWPFAGSSEWDGEESGLEVGFGSVGYGKVPVCSELHLCCHYFAGGMRL